MHVLVVTVVHHPQDARILYRQVRALTRAGHTVTYVAPWSATGALPPDDVIAVDVPRAIGRHRLAAVRVARRRVRAAAADADVLVVHDPELVPAVAGLGGLPIVWDVHEDTRAALTDKTWLPSRLRPVADRMLRSLENHAERHLHLMLAEHAYRERFATSHPVVSNDPPVVGSAADPGTTRVVYLGRLSVGRGVPQLLEVAEHLPAGMRMELIGPADAAVRPALKAAHRADKIHWHGFIPNDRALPMLDGALAGISLLTDKPNYRHSRPTKIVEYMSRGIPVVTTPLPVAVDIVGSASCGVLVPFGDTAAVVAALARLRDDAVLRTDMGRRGHAAAHAQYNWLRSGAAFVAQLERWAGFAPNAAPASVATAAPHRTAVACGAAAEAAWDALSLFDRDAPGTPPRSLDDRSAAATPARAAELSSVETV